MLLLCHILEFTVAINQNLMYPHPYIHLYIKKDHVIRHENAFILTKGCALLPELNHSPTYLDILEAHSNYKVSGPVGETSNSDGRRPGSLWEQLSHDEPGDGTRSDLKEGNKGEDGNDAQVRHPLEFFLEEQR